MQTEWQVGVCRAEFYHQAIIQARVIYAPPREEKVLPPLGRVNISGQGRNWFMYLTGFVLKIRYV